MEYFKEAMFPLVYFQQTNMQDKVQNMLIQMQEEEQRKESHKPWYKKKWGNITKWIDAPSAWTPPPLPSEFWDTLPSTDEPSELEPNQADIDDEDDSFYGDRWPIVLG
ncbi:hypothetical protein OUZ56_000950 [Daphnia magna]|uniref:Uncharacterized protein n=1 Tax=Daphnia magna TaxID=35525 RepID=A0ABR0A1D1_9CRUS|nr:hypothetical protein OUZ56_000950 [Daphnia magna]